MTVSSTVPVGPAPRDPSEAVTGVLARYDELAELITSVAGLGPSDPSLTTAVSPWVLREARLLDGGLLDEWLDGFSDDAVLWVPLDPTVGPGLDQSLFLDDRRRLGERVAWRREPSAWGQQPPSVCTRMVGSIEAWPVSGERATERVVVRSAFTLVEHRHGRRQILAGHQVHELIGSPHRCRTKIIVLPDLRTGVRNPSFLL